MINENLCFAYALNLFQIILLSTIITELYFLCMQFFAFVILLLAERQHSFLQLAITLNMPTKSSASLKSISLSLILCLGLAIAFHLFCLPSRFFIGTTK